MVSWIAEGRVQRITPWSLYSRSYPAMPIANPEHGAKPNVMDLDPRIWRLDRIPAASGRSRARTEGSPTELRTALWVPGASCGRRRGR